MANLSNHHNPNRYLIQKLTLSALFTALIAILAQVAVPLPFSPIPFTGQVAGVLLAGALLDRRTAVLSITAYLLLGAAGAPVFSLARGGIYMLTGPTGGYLWGFIPAVFFAASLIEKKEQPSVYRAAVAMLTALTLIYLCGGIQLGLIMGYSLGQILLVGVIPFLPLDLIKAALAIFLAKQIQKNLEQNKLGHILDGK